MLLALCMALLVAAAMAQHQPQAAGLPRALLQAEKDTPTSTPASPTAKRSPEPTTAEDEREVTPAAPAAEAPAAEDADSPAAPAAKPASPRPAATSANSGLPGAGIPGCPEYIDTGRYRTTDFKDTLNTTTSISPRRPNADVAAGKWIQVSKCNCHALPAGQ